MVFAPDTEVALRSVVGLINTAANGDEQLSTVADLDRFLEAEGFSGSRTRDAEELASVHRLRAELAARRLGLAPARHQPRGAAGRPDEHRGSDGPGGCNPQQGNGADAGLRR